MVRNFYEIMPDEFKRDPYHNPNKCKGVPLHPFRMIIGGASGAGKTNSIVNLIIDCNAFEKIYIFAKELDQPLYKYLIKKLEEVQDKLKKQIIYYSSNIADLPPLSKFDSTKQNLVIFDDMILEKNLTKVEELYVRGRNRNVSVAFLTQSYYAIPKMIRLQTGYILLRGVDLKREFKLIAQNFSLDKSPEELYEMYKEATKLPMQWFMIDLVSPDKTLRYRAGYAPIGGALKSSAQEALLKIIN